LNAKHAKVEARVKDLLTYVRSTQSEIERVGRMSRQAGETQIERKRDREKKTKTDIERKGQKDIYLKKATDRK
jgi:hypothetical protein